MRVVQTHYRWHHRYCCRLVVVDVDVIVIFSDNRLYHIFCLMFGEFMENDHPGKITRRRNSLFFKSIFVRRFYLQFAKNTTHQKLFRKLFDKNRFFFSHE